MSQWGTEKSFKDHDVTIRVLAHVRTDAFDPINHNSVLDMLQLIGVEGDRAHAERMLARLNEIFVEQPYTKWVLWPPCPMP